MRFLAVRRTRSAIRHGDEAEFSAKDGLRIAFGVIWAIDAALKWEPEFRQGFTDTLKGAAQGQPGWLHGWFQFWINVVQPRPDLFAYSTAVIETVIALALIFGFARKLTYIGAALFSFMIWATAEGFGGPYSASSTDIGAAVMYVVVFMGLLALNYESGPSRFSVDYLIERRVSWWYRVAEVGYRRHEPTPVSPAPRNPAAAIEQTPAHDQPAHDHDPPREGGRRYPFRPSNAARRPSGVISRSLLPTAIFAVAGIIAAHRKARIGGNT
jgi:uncharacterized membrane protein YphA (DoxX/SURF4 family)